MTTAIHPQALCESQQIGDRTRVWAFAHILPGAKVGSDCNICDGVFIENDVIVGDRVTVKCGVQLWDGVRLEDDVFVGPNATFTNDRFPRSRVWPRGYAQTIVHRGASVGANATLLPGVSIGAKAMVGAGAVVTRSVPAYGIVVGNPARLVGYTNTSPSSDSPVAPLEDAEHGGVGSRLINLTKAIDMRGALVAGEAEAEIPFAVNRFFLVFDVPTAEVRGEHAHHECEQALVCVRGSVHAVVDTGEARREYVLDRPDLALYMPAQTWGTQYRYSEDAVLLVLASHTYDPDDYIRSYDEFLAIYGPAGAKPGA